MPGAGTARFCSVCWTWNRTCCLRT